MDRVRLPEVRFSELRVELNQPGRKMFYWSQLLVQLQLLLSAAASSAGSPHNTASLPVTQRD